MQNYWQELLEALQLVTVLLAAAAPGTPPGAVIPLPQSPTLTVNGQKWALMSADGATPPVIKRLA